MQQPFDRTLRRLAMRRAALFAGGHDFLHRHVADELAARAALAGPVPADRVLHVGVPVRREDGERNGERDGEIVVDAGSAAADVVADEDLLPFADASFARISALMTLHGVNDLPGALLLCRRMLLPGGRFAAAFPAGHSLGAVREAFLHADSESGAGVAPRVGPTVDPAQAAGLLQRAGFVEPVADVETLVVRYRCLADLARDVRGNGGSGWLAARARRFTTRSRWAAAEAAFALQADADGKVPVTVQILYLSARAPG